MRYQFDEFTLDTERFELTRAGAALHAEPQVIELLALLVEQRERMVTKEEINDKVWRGRVVSDAALSSRIKMLRQLLDDDGQAQRYIRTIHKRGFRFVGQLRPIDTAAVAPPPFEVITGLLSFTGVTVTVTLPESEFVPSVMV